MNKTSVKLTDENKGFLDRIGTNRVICKTETRTKSFSQNLDIIEKYFKLNNDKYLEMCRMEDIKNV